MDWLVVSNIVLWVGFLVMVVVNLALARQIGVLYERVAPAGALMTNQKLAGLSMWVKSKTGPSWCSSCRPIARCATNLRRC